MRDLSLKQISSPISAPFQVPKLFSFAPLNSRQHMATKNNNLPPESTAVKVNKDQEEKKEKKLPPPPEKPEAGDCCGSGCVRCVWDVYYEELEAYNKLYKSDSNSSGSKHS